MTSPKKPPYRQFRVESDESAEMTYIHLREPAAGQVAETVAFGGLNVDLDSEGRAVGVELHGLLGPILTRSTLAATFPDWFSPPTITTTCVSPSELAEIKAYHPGRICRPDCTHGPAQNGQVSR